MYTNSNYRGLTNIDGELLNPLNGLPVTKEEDGLYHSNDQTFILDEERGNLIPQFIPDDTLESAHIEGDHLVGDTTGRKFPIDERGNVVLPYDPIDLDPEASMKETEEYFRARRDRQMGETQEEIDEQIRKDREYNQEQIDKLEENLSSSYSSQLRAQREELKRIEENSKNGQITENDFNKLLAIAEFDANQSKALRDAFTAAGILIPSKENNMGEALQSSGIQRGQ